MDRLAQMQVKIEKLKTLDKDYNIFGSATHKYKLNKPLSEEDILAFEATHNLTLPIDYRNFIRHVGNGGMGPYYGLLPLEENEGELQNLTLEFPYTAEQPLSLNKLYNSLLEIYCKDNNLSREGITHEQEDNFIDTLYEDVTKELYKKATQGIKFLCHEGCGMCDILILKGASAGQVWFFDFTNDVGVFPLEKPNEDIIMTFYDLYELWLDMGIESLGM